MVNQTRRVLPLLSDVRKSAHAKRRKQSRGHFRKSPTRDFQHAAISRRQCLPDSFNDDECSKRCNSFLGETQTSDSTTQPHAKSSSAVNGSGNERRKRFAHATEKQTGNSVQQSRQSVPGVLSCPCVIATPLEAEHAGKIGRCIQCQTRCSLQTTSAQSDALTMSRPLQSLQTGASSPQMIWFSVTRRLGVRLSKRYPGADRVLMLMATVLGTALFIHQLTKVDLE